MYEIGCLVSSPHTKNSDDALDPNFIRRVNYIISTAVETDTGVAGLQGPTLTDPPRTVPITRSPSASAEFAIAKPNPRETPVMNHVLVTSIL